MRAILVLVLIITGWGFIQRHHSGRGSMVSSWDLGSTIRPDNDSSFFIMRVYSSRCDLLLVNLLLTLTSKQQEYNYNRVRAISCYLWIRCHCRWVCALLEDQFIDTIPKYMLQKRKAHRNSLGGPTNAPFISIKLTTFAEVTKIRPLSMSVNALAASCDVVITTILCTLLQHSRTGFQISDTIINKLIMFSISTGLLTSACAVMSLVSVCNKSQLAHVALTT